MSGKETKRILSFLLSVLFFGMVFPPMGQPEPKNIKDCGMAPVIDENIGRAKAQALSDAKRNAVEKGIGTLVASQTLVKDAQLIKDRIYSQASGYVSDYKIVSEGLTPSGRMYELCIVGTVDTANLKDDLRAIGILKQQIGNPRFMTVYYPEAKDTAGENALAVSAVRTVIDDAFLEKGFLVLDKRFVKDIAGDPGQKPTSDLSDLSRRALKHQADLLLLFDIDAFERTDLSNQFFKELKLTVQIRAVAPATAEIIARKGKSRTVRTSSKMEDNYLENAVFANDFTKLTQQVSDSLLEDTLSYFERQSHEGTRFSCLFKDFDPKQIILIVEVIENMSGFKDKNLRSRFSDSIQIDINYLGKRFDFQNELMVGLRKKGIDIEIREASGNEFFVLPLDD